MSSVAVSDATVAVASLTAGSLRSQILFHHIPSLFATFRDRKNVLVIPFTLAAARTTKVRDLPMPKGVTEAAAAALTAVSQQRVVVDLGAVKKGATTYGAVYTSEPDSGSCWHCRRPVGIHKVGIPLRVRDDRFHHLLIVDFEGRACHDGCAYKFILDHVAESVCYEGRATVMRQINEIRAPGTKLIPAPCWRLLQIHGGPLTDDQFDSAMQTFAPTPQLQYRLCSLSYGPS